VGVSASLLLLLLLLVWSLLVRTWLCCHFGCTMAFVFARLLLFPRSPACGTSTSFGASGVTGAGGASDAQ
jgi:hypothetical protein